MTGVSPKECTSSSWEGSQAPESRLLAPILRAALESYGATVGVVDDEHFHALAPTCAVCAANMTKVKTKQDYCFTCPASLESEALFPAIAAEVRIIASSDAFEKNPLGFVIVQGRSVCGSAPLV